MAVLIGVGGHGKLVAEVAQMSQVCFTAFMDPQVATFSGMKKLNEDDSFTSFFLGIGGVNSEQLEKRQAMFRKYRKTAECMGPIISPHAFVAQSAVIGNGTFVNVGAIIQSSAQIGENVIVNSGTIIEHDVRIDDGAHIAPGAIVLGGAHIKSTVMVGAGAVILPGRTVLESTLVPSLTRY